MYHARNNTYGHTNAHHVLLHFCASVLTTLPLFIRQADCRGAGDRGRDQRRRAGPLQRGPGIGPRHLRTPEAILGATPDRVREVDVNSLSEHPRSSRRLVGLRGRWQLLIGPPPH